MLACVAHSLINGLAGDLERLGDLLARPPLTVERGEDSALPGQGELILHYSALVASLAEDDPDLPIYRATLSLVRVAPELADACRAIAALADGQGRMNMLEVAGQARAALAKAGVA